MNVSLTPEVESGMYGSRSEVVRQRLRLLAERDQLLAARLQQLREEIADGLGQARADRLVPEEVFAEIEKMARHRREAGN